jgi:hypothetical protein
LAATFLQSGPPSQSLAPPRSFVLFVTTISPMAYTISARITSVALNRFAVIL